MNRPLSFVLALFCLVTSPSRQAHAQTKEFEERSLIFRAPQESQVGEALREFRNFEYFAESAHALAEIRREEGEQFSRAPFNQSLEILRSLGLFYRQRFPEAQAALARTVQEAPNLSRAYTEASLLSALEFYSRTPLSRENVEAGLKRLSDLARVNAARQQVRAEIHFWTAEGYQALGLYGQALEEYKLASQMSTPGPLIPLTNFRLGELFERQQEYAAAEEAFGRVVETRNSPLRIQASIRRAAVLRSLGRFADVLSELNRAEQLAASSKHWEVASTRSFAYSSPMVESLLLTRTEDDRVMGSAVLEVIDQDTAAQLITQLFEAEIGLLRGSARVEQGEYAKATQILSDAETYLATLDKSSLKVDPQEFRFFENAIKFEKAWALFQQGSYEESSKAFLALAESGADRKQILKRDAVATLREQGRYYDPFYDEPESRLREARLDTMLLDNTLIDTTFFFYNDFPERSQFYAGVALARAGRLDEAERVLLRLSQDPSVLYSSRANYQLALLRFSRKNYLQAEPTLLSLSTERSLSGAYSSFLLGELSYRRNLFNRAERYFTLALETLPDSANKLRETAYLERGLSYIPLGAWAAATADLQRYLVSARSEKGKTDEALYWLGKAFVRVGQNDSAETTFQRLINNFETSDRAIDARYELAWAQFRQDRYREAETNFLRVIQMDTITRFAYDALARAGDAAYAEGDMLRANQLYNLAVDRPAFNDYRTSRALLQLGVTRFKLDSIRSAANNFEYMIRRYSKSDLMDEAHFNLAVAYYGIQQSAKAEQTVEKITQQYAESGMAPRGLLLAANERVRSGDNSGSLAFFSRVIDRYPNSVEAMSALFAMQGVLLELKGPEQAIALADTFLTRYPENQAVQAVLMQKGRLLLTLGNGQGARTAFNTFVTRFPEHADISLAKHYSAMALLTSGDTVAASEELSAVTREYQGFEAASLSYLELARLNRNRDPDAAARFYREAYDIQYFSSDGAITAMGEHADLLIAQGKKDSAIAVLQLLVDRYTTDTRPGARAQLRMGQMYLDDKRYADARRVLEPLAERRKRDIYGGGARVRIAESYLEEGNTTRAIEEFKRAGSEHTLTVDAEGRRLWGLAQAQLKEENKKAAITALTQMARLPGLAEKEKSRARNLLDQLQPRKKVAPAKPKKKGGKR